MMRLMVDWNIQTRASACYYCRRDFQNEETYHTILFDLPQGYERLDVCDSCWRQQFSQGAKDKRGYISHWQGTYEAPPPPVEPIARETAETLLRRLVAQPEYESACYILAI